MNKNDDYTGTIINNLENQQNLSIDDKDDTFNGESLAEAFERSKRESEFYKYNLSEKRMYIFKNFINFLEIYGQENFGCGYEVNWTQVHRMIVEHNIFDFNDELDEVIYHKEERFDSEEFRDRCYKYIEDQILKGYPVWHVFKLSKHLTDILQKEEDEKLMESFRKKFNTHMCYKCKHFKDKIKIRDQMKIFTVEEYLKKYPTVRPLDLPLEHNMTCEYREKRVEEIKDHEREYKLPWIDREGKINLILKKEGFSSKLLFEKDGYMYKHEFILKPLRNQCKCKFFEEVKDLTFEKYIERNFEII